VLSKVVTRKQAERIVGYFAGEAKEKV